MSSIFIPFIPSYSLQSNLISWLLNFALKGIQIKQKYLIPIIQEGQKKSIFTYVISAEEISHTMTGTFRL